MKKITLFVPHPHVKPIHVKHSAASLIVSGTIMEALHMFYPAGLILLGIAGCIAVYEPHLIHEVRLNEED